VGNGRNIIILSDKIIIFILCFHLVRERWGMDEIIPAKNRLLKESDDLGSTTACKQNFGKRVKPERCSNR